MKQVYAPANAAEAHMLAHLLEQAGIRAHVHGEALQGAVGELPAANLLQLLVPDEDHDRARKLLLEWERVSAPSEKQAPAPKKRVPVATAMSFLVLGALAGWGLNTIIDQSRISWMDSSRQEVDRNGDDRPDITYFYRLQANYPYRGEWDNNFDGRVDDIVYYDEIGEPSEQKSDEDLDGVLESLSTFRNSLLHRSDVDTDGNGEPDVVLKYERGVVKREEITDPGHGIVVRINFYERGRLDRAEIDLDRDGFRETSRSFDRFGEITKTETRRRD